MQPEGQIVTGEAVALDLELANVGSRGIAALIDLAIILVAQLALLIPILVLGSGNVDAGVAVLILGEILIVLGYPVGLETLWRGRTVGKAVMGLRVVRDDGGPIRFRHAFVRGLVGVFVEKPGFTYGLGAVICIIASNRRKRIGDFAAGTLVLQERVPGRLDAPVTMPPALAGWAAGLDLGQVDDELALRLRHFISRAGQLTPQARNGLEHQLANEVVTRVGPAPSETPAWAVITAVLAERRRRAFGTSQPSGHPAPVPAGWAPPATSSGTPAADPPTAQPAQAVPEPPTGFIPPG